MIAADNRATNRKEPAKVNGARRSVPTVARLGPMIAATIPPASTSEIALGRNASSDDLGGREAQMQRRCVRCAEDSVGDAEQDEAALIHRRDGKGAAGRADHGADEEGIATPDQRSHQMRNRNGRRHRDHELKAERHGRQARIGGEHLSRQG